MRATRVAMAAATAGAALALTLAPANAQTAPRQDISVSDGVYLIQDPASDQLLTVQTEEPRQRVTMRPPLGESRDSHQEWHITCTELLGCAIRNELTGTYLALTGLPNAGKPVITKPAAYRWLITAAPEDLHFISRSATPEEEFRVNRSQAFIDPPLVDVQPSEDTDDNQQWRLEPHTSE